MRLPLPRMLRRLLLLTMPFFAVAAAVHFAGYLSAMAFLSSLEDRLLAGVAANHTEAEPVITEKPPWRQYLVLAPGQGRTASAGLDSPLEYFAGRLRASFVLAG